MSATIELKYYNSFWAKKIKSMTDIDTIVAGTTAAGANTTTIPVGSFIAPDTISDLKIGMLVKIRWCRGSPL